MDLTEKYSKEQSCDFHQTSTVAWNNQLVFQVHENGSSVFVHSDYAVGPDELSILNGIHEEYNFNAS